MTIWVNQDGKLRETLALTQEVLQYNKLRYLEFLSLAVCLFKLLLKCVEPSWWILFKVMEKQQKINALCRHVIPVVQVLHWASSHLFKEQNYSDSK